MIAPPFGDTGGPEIAVQNLVNAFSKMKEIDVTLFAPGDWKTKAKLIPTLNKSLWNTTDFKKQTPRERANLIIHSQLKFLEYEKRFDLIHTNSQPFAYLAGKLSKKPVVLTMHNRIKEREFQQIKSARVSIVSLTKTQTRLKTSAVIGNGVPIKNLDFSLKAGDYLITIGRLTDQKGIDIAIKIAKKANKKLLIFGRKGDTKERKKYFDKKIKPYLDKKQIIYKGEASNPEIYKYLKNAKALLFPIRRPEAFGLVAIEALSCGTPVIGTKINPLPEILKSKEVAFLSNDINELVKAAKTTRKFDRKKCREYAEKYFDSSVVANKYIELYKKILKKKKV